MATRFYLPTAGTSPLSSQAIDSTWEGSVSTFFRAPAPTVKTSSAARNDAARFLSTSTQQNCWGQWISAPLAAAFSFTTSHTYSAVVRGIEGDLACDAHIAIVIRVVSADGATVRGTIASLMATSTELDVTWATRIKAATALTAVSASAGDRIVIEIGSHGVTPSTAYDVTWRFGDGAAADFALTEGLTSADNPWVELSPTLTFGHSNVIAVSGAAAGSAVVASESFPATVAVTGAAAGTAIAATVAPATVVTSGLSAEFIASEAKGADLPGNNSDPTGTWTDMLAQHDGVLNTFAYTTSSGWAGAGTAGDPYCLKFDGASDYVIPSAMGVADTRTFTYEAWVKYTSASAGLNIFSEGGSGASNPFTQLNAGVAADGYLRFQIRNNAGSAASVTSSPTAYNDGAWHHVVGTSDGTTMRLYVDGVEVGTPATTPAAPITCTQVRIGARGYTTPAYYWGGSIATVRTYDRALSRDEAANNWSAGVTAASGIDNRVTNATATVAVSAAAAGAEVTALETFPGTAAVTAGAAGAAIVAEERFANTVAVTASAAGTQVAAEEKFTGTSAVSAGAAGASISAQEKFVGTVAVAAAAAGASIEAATTVAPTTMVITVAGAAAGFQAIMVSQRRLRGSARADGKYIPSPETTDIMKTGGPKMADLTVTVIERGGAKICQ